MLFGTLPDGRAVEAYTLANDSGMSVRILTLGGIVQSVLLPDRLGTPCDVALGFLHLTGYLDDPAYHGALVGRYANRIAGGRFALDGITYELTRNDGRNTLHGGTRGLSAAIWSVENVDGSALVLSHLSPDGDQGFPGNLSVRATYALSAEDTLQLTFEASSDAPTVLNLSNHTYWNLSGEETILDHSLQVDASTFTPVDEQFVPTGEIRSVDGTSFDFRKPGRIRDTLLQSADPLFALAGGIDHNFILDRKDAGDLVRAATLAGGGRHLAVWTTEPALQVYTGNSLAGGAMAKPGRPYPRWAGIALETQHFPNSPNEPSFPSTILRPGETFRSRTEFRFGPNER
jgi:aldose 1-epimerase